jgi:2-dehydropantoate 2-reductase
MAPEERLAVYGAGAVGGYLGGKLSGTGVAEVTLIGRPRMVAVVAEHGLILREQGGDEVSRPRAVDSAQGLEPFDAVLLTVRTYDVAASIPDLRALLGPEGILLAFQNGVGTEEILAEVLGPERVFPCTLTVSVGMEEPGIVTGYSRSGGIALSSMSDHPVPEWIVRTFIATGLPTAVIPDYRSLRWSKLLLNMLAAPTSAILDMDITQLLSDPSVFRVERGAFLEAARVMDAARIKPVSLPGYPVPLARLAMRLPAPMAQRTLGRRIASARSGRSPGMRGDLNRGKSEIADFNGAIAREGDRLAVPTPVNRALTNLLQDLAAYPERREEYRGNPEALTTYVEHSHRLRHTSHDQND